MQHWGIFFLSYRSREMRIIPMANLVCKDLNMTFAIPRTGAADVVALQDINFTLKKGELLSVLGPSGCRKTIVTLSQHQKI